MVRPRAPRKDGDRQSNLIGTRPAARRCAMTAQAGPPKPDEHVYVPDLDAAAREAVARLRVVRGITTAISNDDYADCEGYDISVVEDLIDGVIALLKASI